MTATPTAPPTVREKPVIEVAAPRSARGTAVWTAISMGTKTRPIPTPASAASRAAARRVTDSLQPVNRKKAPASATIPATTTGRNPARSASHAPTIEHRTQPSANGMSRNPAWVALWLATAWR